MIATEAAKMTAARLRARHFPCIVKGGEVEVPLTGHTVAHVTVTDNGYRGQVVLGNGAVKLFHGMSFPMLTTFLGRH